MPKGVYPRTKPWLYGPKPRPMAERILEKVQVDPQTDCWNWLGFVAPDGYGQIGVKGGTSRSVHRASYKCFVGEIPPGLQLDHLCRNRACVNPAHLEPVTARVNTMRSNASSAVNARKTHCKRGHELVGENVSYYRDGLWRRCLACLRMRKSTPAGRFIPDDAASEPHHG